MYFHDSDKCIPMIVINIVMLIDIAYLKSVYFYDSYKCILVTVVNIIVIIGVAY